MCLVMGDLVRKPHHCPPDTRLFVEWQWMPLSARRHVIGPMRWTPVAVGEPKSSRPSSNAPDRVHSLRNFDDVVPALISGSPLQTGCSRSGLAGEWLRAPIPDFGWLSGWLTAVPPNLIFGAVGADGQANDLATIRPTAAPAHGELVLPTHRRHSRGRNRSLEADRRVHLLKALRKAQAPQLPVGLQGAHLPNRPTRCSPPAVPPLRQRLV